jgi:hypothetical protein
MMLRYQGLMRGLPIHAYYNKQAIFRIRCNGLETRKLHRGFPCLAVR